MVQELPSITMLVLGHCYSSYTLRSRFMGPTWCPPGSCRPQMGPMMAQWTLLYGYLQRFPRHHRRYQHDFQFSTVYLAQIFDPEFLYASHFSSCCWRWWWRLCFCCWCWGRDRLGAPMCPKRLEINPWVWSSWDLPSISREPLPVLAWDLKKLCADSYCRATPSTGRTGTQSVTPFMVCRDMMTSSNGNIFRVTGHFCGNSPVTGEFTTQRPVTQSFDVFFDLRLNKLLSKQWWGWWFETSSHPCDPICVRYF